MSHLDSLMQSLREFEDSPEGYGYQLRLDFATLVMQQLDALGWNQSTLAKESGKTESYISRIIHSDSNCSFSIVGEILHSLGVRPRLVVNHDEEQQLRMAATTEDVYGEAEEFHTETTEPYQIAGRINAEGATGTTEHPVSTSFRASVGLVRQCAPFRAHG